MQGLNLAGNPTGGATSIQVSKNVEHFADILYRVPSIIIINLNESDFDDIAIEDSLMGVSKLVLLKDRSTDKIIPKIERGDWTAFKRDSKLEKIGAIICYKRDFDLTGRVIYNKRIFAISFTEEKCELLLNLF